MRLSPPLSVKLILKDKEGLSLFRFYPVVLLQVA